MKCLKVLLKQLSSRKFWWRTVSAGLVALILIILINVYVLNGKSSLIYKKIDQVPAKQVALVLGARVFSNGKMSGIMYDRALTTVELYRANKIQKILISGDHGTVDYDEVNAIKNYFLQMKIPAKDIFLDHAGFDTYDSVYRAKAIFQVESMIIVTQEFHLPRALYLAQALNINAVGFSADKQKYLGQSYNNFREFFSRVKAFWDISIHAKPKFAGEIIPILGDSQLSWD